MFGFDDGIGKTYESKNSIFRSSGFISRASRIWPKLSYKVAEFFNNPEIKLKTEDLVRAEINRIMPKVHEYKKKLTGKKAAIYVGGAFKAISLVKALRNIGMDTALVGTQTGNKNDYEEIKAVCDDETVIVDDITNPLELTKFIREKNIDLLIGGVKERPIAYKMGIGFCDHNHERKEILSGFEGMVNFSDEVYKTVLRPVWSLCRIDIRTLPF